MNDVHVHVPLVSETVFCAVVEVEVDLEVAYGEFLLLFLTYTYTCTVIFSSK